MISKRKAPWPRNISYALFAGLIATAFYDALSYTRSLHGFSVKALGPAIHVVNTHLDTAFSAGYFNYLEVLVVNVLLYAFYSFLILTAVDLFRRAKRKETSSN